MIPLQIGLLLLATAALLAAAALPDRLPLRSALDEVRRLWRKQAPVSGRGWLAHLPALILGLDTAACLLVPVAGLDLPFADLPMIFALLATGRVVATLAAVEWGGPAGGTAAMHALRLFPGAGAGMVLATVVVAGLGGGATALPAALAAVRDPGSWQGLLPLSLVAGAVAALGVADLALPGPEAVAGGRALAVLRVARVVRLLAWLDLVAALLPPWLAGFWPGMLAWAVKLAVLAGLHARWSARLPRMPALADAAGLLAFMAALLLVLRGPAA